MSSDGQGAQALSRGDFEAVVGGAAGPVLVDFWAAWCPPCRAIAPTIDRLAERFRSRAVVGKVDVDAEGELARRFGVSSIPTLLVFKDGRVVDRVVGIASENDLASRLERAVA